jgi:leader peptidase (prepilin peptidase) / N-methyltransferase
MLNVVGLCLAFTHAAVHESDNVLWAVAMAAMRGAALALVFLALRGTYMWWRRREGLGLGDVKLAAVAGAWLDWPMLPVVIEIAAVSALTGHILRQKLRRRAISPTGRVPFGVFFAPAIWICWAIEMTWMVPR